MAFRIEVRKTRSPAWSWFVEQAGKLPGYSVTGEGRDEVHSVDGLSFDEAVRLWELAGDWKGVSIYKDDEQVSVRRFRKLAWQEQWNASARRSGLTDSSSYIGTCPRCSTSYRLNSVVCPTCGIGVAPIDAAAVRELPPEV